jgi:anti-sigma B factor antagonist
MEMIKTGKEQGAVIIDVKGRVDSVAAPEFEKRLDELINQGETRIIFNLSELDYISSAGLRCILVMVKNLEDQKGKIVLAAAKPSVVKVLEISGIAAVIPISESIETALAQM